MGGESSSVGLARRLERLQLAGWLGQGGLVLASAGASLILRDRLGARLDWPLALLGIYLASLFGLRAVLYWHWRRLLHRHERPIAPGVPRTWWKASLLLWTVSAAVAVFTGAAMYDHPLAAVVLLGGGGAAIVFIRNRPRPPMIDGWPVLPPDERLLAALPAGSERQKVQPCCLARDDPWMGVQAGRPLRLAVSRPTLELLDVRELRALLYHELAHVQLKHLAGPVLPRVVGFGYFGAVAGATALALHLWSVPEALARLPVVLLWLWVAKMLLGPLLLARSRRRERDAHAWALENGADPDTYAAALTKLNDAMGHGRGRAPLWALLLFNSHPTLDETLEQIDRHRRREPGRQGATT